MPFAMSANTVGGEIGQAAGAGASRQGAVLPSAGFRRGEK